MVACYSISSAPRNENENEIECLRKMVDNLTAIIKDLGQMNFKDLKSHNKNSLNNMLIISTTGILDSHFHFVVFSVNT